MGVELAVSSICYKRSRAQNAGYAPTANLNNRRPANLRTQLLESPCSLRSNVGSIYLSDSGMVVSVKQKTFSASTYGQLEFAESSRALRAEKAFSYVVGSKFSEASTTLSESSMLTLHHLNDSRSQRILWLLVAFFLLLIHGEFAHTTRRRSWKYRTRSRNTIAQPNCVRLKSCSILVPSGSLL
jgi:hypothetical protein